LGDGLLFGHWMTERRPFDLRPISFGQETIDFGIIGLRGQRGAAAQGQTKSYGK
jgi:hypothetical protein